MIVLEDGELRRRAGELQWLFLDVDGVLTDGGIILVGETDEAKRFDVQDGMGVTLARAAGLKVGIITGRISAVVQRRATELKIDTLSEGHFNKGEALNLLMEKHDLNLSRVAYVGDDVLDLSIMKRVALPIAVSNARAEVKAQCVYVSENSGGHGAVREIVDWLLELRDQKAAIYQKFSE